MHQKQVIHFFIAFATMVKKYGKKRKEIDTDKTQKKKKNANALILFYRLTPTGSTSLIISGSSFCR